MRAEDRIDRWLADLDSTLATAVALAARGAEAYADDDALALAFEALANRVGDLAKKLITADAGRFSDDMWRAAARTRDFIVHHYDRIDTDVLWRTVTGSFPALRELVRSQIDIQRP
ncbi:HepT-like ribonuclease domain-containing protein [uncultured Microbacterium sp.]|uniref:HepT-like ribonuclease domain-containing protein n=1 Tax=uncultured Microbacterium sp. TaxID=191216 RepID=UPI00262BB7A4|nr:HepT-like ribonuclease domain-containing protein [uncultured Microbacterium sp.]